MVVFSRTNFQDSAFGWQKPVQCPPGELMLELVPLKAQMLVFRIAVLRSGDVTDIIDRFNILKQLHINLFRLKDCHQGLWLDPHVHRQKR